MKKNITLVLGMVLGMFIGIARADFTFGTLAFFDEPINSTGVEYFGCISSDGLEIYIDKPVGGGMGASDWDIYVSTRGTTNDLWSAPVNLGSTVNTGGIGDGSPSISGDGLELYFSSRRSGGYGEQDIWVTTRDSKGVNWGAPINLGPTINTSGRDWLPWITTDGLELYFSSERSGGYGGNDIWVASRATANDEWGEPINLGSVVNSTAGEFYPCLSPDGLVLFFSDYDHTMFGFRPGGYGLSDMWMTRRKSAADPWKPPVNLGSGMNTNAWDSQPRVSPDGTVLYFSSSRPEAWMLTEKEDIWQAPIIPIVDFTGEGMVNIKDLTILIEHWGQNEPAYDIGPMPWGDGVIDAADLEVLMRYWGQEVPNSNLLANWKFDEIEGDVAYDSAAENDAGVLGDAVWQPDSGQINGALLLDGINDYINTHFELNPADGSFSVFAWVKGGGPGQVILSQEAISDWLLADRLTGCLESNLKGTGRSKKALTSETSITDGHWHRVGLVWDGAYRSLYVDDVLVAQDITHQGSLESSIEAFNIGVGKGLEAGTFWSGMIDDVRIYNRVVTP